MTVGKWNRDRVTYKRGQGCTLEGKNGGDERIKKGKMGVRMGRGAEA